MLSDRGAYLLLILVTAMWGSYFPLTKLALREIPPLTFVALRFSLAAPFLWLILLPDRRAVRPGRGDLVPFLFLGFSGYVLGTALTYVGVHLTTAINASLIQAAAPVMVAVVSAVFLKEALRPVNWAGVSLSVLGVLLIVSGGAPGRLLRGSFHSGDLVLIVSQVGWAAYTIYGRTVLKRYSPAVATTYAYTVAALVLVPISLLEAPLAPLLDASLLTWGIILFQALLGGLAHVWYYAGVRAVGASRSVVFMNLSPLVGVLLATLLVGETLRGGHLVGGAVVLAGVFLTTRR
ncbi:MAG TPA: DMT family transporter [Candidatus Methylomirabilis sp.]|nr:DMT family transporter [Candidatus Methylomirabilis sp.]